MKQGIIFRRDLKAKLILTPPEVGEMVFATDTGEHGWMSNLGNIVWRKLTVDKEVSENEGSIDCVNTEHIFVEANQSNSGNLEYVEVLTLDYVDLIGVKYNIAILYKEHFNETLNPFTPAYDKYYTMDMSGMFIIPDDMTALDSVIDSTIFLKGTITDGTTVNVIGTDYTKRLCFRVNIDNTVTVLLKSTNATGMEINYFCDFVPQIFPVGLSKTEVI